MNLIKKINILWKIKKFPSSILSKKEEEVFLFQTKGMNLITEHLKESEYKEHKALIREIIYLSYYTFEVLKDDYYKGDKILFNNITRIDDYVFSKYKKVPILESNIECLITIAFSNRFNQLPPTNLLAYFVFLEEIGFEIIMLFDDFYKLLFNVDKFKYKQYFSENVILEEKNVNKEDLLREKLMPEKISERLSPLVVQQKIMESFVNKKH